MPKHPWRRIAAWGIDCGLILVYAGAIAAVCVPLYLAGIIRDVPLALANLVAALLLVFPAVFALAGLEAGPRQASVGRRAVKLHLTDVRGGRVTYARAALRNALKFGLPWLLAHAAVYGLWDGSARDEIPAWVWPFLAAAYAIPIAYLVSLFVRAGRTPYDRLTRTAVVSANAPDVPLFVTASTME